MAARRVSGWNHSAESPPQVACTHASSRAPSIRSIAPVCLGSPEQGELTSTQHTHQLRDRWGYWVNKLMKHAGN